MKNKLASIISLWDGSEMLKYAVDSVNPDLFIIVYQDVSNYGEWFDPMPDIERAIGGKQYVLHRYFPALEKSGTWNETRKRNIGLDLARKNRCSHFFFQDADELYEDFNAVSAEYWKSGSEGSVCPILTYFKLPTLRFESYDNYYVPFIHELRPKTEAGHQVYPYYVDPTRKTKCKDVVLLSQPMHHFSYVRRDIVRKCRNSSAKANIERSDILNDYAKAAPGYYVKDFFGQKLAEVENLFGIEV